MVNKSIWATESEFVDIGCRVIKWDEPGGLDFSKTAKFTNTKCQSLDELRAKVKQFTLHWSATYKAKHMHGGLIARGLSVNFMIDDDCDAEGFATIYQCLPINKLGWSQGSHTNGVSFNALGPGVEISYMPQKWEEDMYDANDRAKWKVPEHKSVKAPIHGTALTVHIPTDAQMKSVKHLTKGICTMFPDIPKTFPKDNSGNVLTTVLKDPLGYKGLAGHFHLRREKIDPAGLDFKSIEEFIK